jgi:hypothetical protein
MIVQVIVPKLLLGVLLVGADGPATNPAESAADRLTLHDGRSLLGLVTAVTPGPRGGVELVVRRGWAEKHLKDRLELWDRAAARSTRLALTERQKRLAAWRTERAAGAAGDDRILAWIDQELGRLSAPGGPPPSVLLAVRLARSDVRAMERRPAPNERLLRLAWLCRLPDPESTPLDDLKEALTTRGYTPEAAAKNAPASLDRLLRPVPEPEQMWLARRAATEVTVDSDLRFVRFQDTVIPDTAGGQGLNGIGLNTALSELKRLLDVDQAGRSDPLLEKLKEVAARGRRGAVVTRLLIQEDLSAVSVESTLWVRVGADRWAAYGSKTATVRPDDLAADAGKPLADDPQVKGAFQIVEMLGLGSIAEDVKRRTLRIGAATERALEKARSAFNQDVSALALPVLEPAGDAAPAAAPQPNP